MLLLSVHSGFSHWDHFAHLRMGLLNEGAWLAEPGCPGDAAKGPASPGGEFLLPGGGRQACRGATEEWLSALSLCPLSVLGWRAFRSSPDLTGVVAVCEDLRRKGLEFPMTDLDMLSPIHRPRG